MSDIALTCPRLYPMSVQIHQVLLNLCINAATRAEFKAIIGIVAALA